jgi:carboxyl-terminal processing protease
MIFKTTARKAFSFSVALTFLIATSLLAQHLTSQQQSQAARLVHDMIEQSHISQKHIDDTVSAKLVDEYIKMLDPQKLYFLQSDIDRFNKYRTELDDLIKAGNVDFATMVFEVYLERLNERMDMAHKLIDTANDFTVKESIEIDAKDLPWSKTAEESNERWRKRIKYEFLLMKLETPAEIAAREKRQNQGNPLKKAVEGDSETPPVTTDEDARKRLHKRYKTIRDSLGKTEPEEVVEMYLTALCATFDPHSNYMSPRAQNDFQIQMRLKLEGIGAALRSEDGYTIVANIVPGGAAAADGRLKVNDKILAVGSGTAEFVDVVEMKLTKVVELIRGKKGTKVRLKVLAAATSDVKIYELTRQVVELKQSEVKGEIIDSATRVPGTKGKVGIIHIPSFYRDFEGEEAGEPDFKSTSRDVRKVLHDFQAKGGVDSIIVDLRNNGGGALKEAIEVSGLFVGEGPVVQVKDQKGKPKVYRDDSKTVYSGPLVVLTNRLSASASEIFAGVIKDYNRGLIVGDRTTHGKGTVQSVIPVGQRFLQIIKSQDLGALKLTINQFYRVNGDSTQNTGVPSDVALPSLIDNMDLGESFLDNALPPDQIDAVPHRHFKNVTTEIANSLRENSRKRIAASTDFQKIEKDIDKFLARKQRKSIPLNEEDLRKERVTEEQNARDKAEAAGDDFSDDPVVFAEGSYNNEVLSILNDYVSLLNSANVSKK